MKTISTLQGNYSNEGSSLSLKAKISVGVLKGGKELISFAKYLYLVSVLVLLVCAVIELKHIFHVDLFPGVDTPIDNVYYAGKDAASQGIF
ncbi:MAG: hypothetical protein LCH37_00110 [Bacteroidetes bacterium]|mgnify:CR=1 FL=1|nr:hypothetical protein [Bacteroidota bacterium]MCK6609612.1 hypothetical protein [Bacteroidia bacterium]